MSHKNLCCNQPKICTKLLCHKAVRHINADGMENNADPDQTQSDLGLHCCMDPVQKLTDLP